MKKTPLNQVHHRSGARMVEFVGWEMPVQYQSALQEHLAVRAQAGLFDVSHMGEIEVIGAQALAFTQSVTCNDVARLAIGQVQYSALLTPDGTFVDDILVYRIGDEHFFICVNASNKDKDYQWLRSRQQGNVEVIDNSESYAQMALQGPKSEQILQKLTAFPLSSIRYYWFAWTEIAGVRSLVSRTGYTGEDGFEVYLPPDSAPGIWEELMAAGRPLGLIPAGLAARNTLRLEVCYPLYGSDIDDTITPWEAGLGWIVKPDKGDFVGKEALVKQKQEGIRRRLEGFEMIDRGIARDHFPVYLEDEPIGHVTSGSYSPSLEKSIGLTYLPVDRDAEAQLYVEIRGKRLAAKPVKTPFLRKDRN
jgi:aminomethyltransferase